MPDSTDLAADSPPKRAGILLVDGDPADLASLRALLDGLGIELVAARSAEEALGLAETREFAAVLLDVRSPGSVGFNAARAIRADRRFRATPILLLAGDDIDPADVERGYALGAVDVLVRPMSPVVVRAKLGGLVAPFRERQLASREAEQLRLLVHGTTDYAIFMLDPGGHVASWNAGAERLKGYTAGEIVGRHFSRFYPQEAIDRGWPEHELRVAGAEGRFEDEGWRLKKDGSLFWANVVITALRDERGRLRGFSKITRDLTERKRAEESLRRSEERFRLLVEGVKDYAIFMLDPGGHVATWNPGAERIKGYTAGEIVGRHFSRFYPQEAIDRGWPEHELRVAGAEGRFEDEGWRLKKDGSLFWANVVITALRDERGALLGFSKITRDLTERKRAEEDARRLAEEAAARRAAERNAALIREQRERLRVTLSSIGDAVISTDARGRVEFLNPVAEELVGWKTDEAVGRALVDVFRIVNEETRLPVENPALRALSEGRIVGLANHTLLIARDGVERPIDDSAAPIRDAEGRVIGSVLVFRDITERRSAENRLREQREWLSVTLASIGDAVIAADAGGRVTYLNGVARRLTGWDEAEARGRPLESVFVALDGQTRRPVESPVGEVLRGGAVVGLDDHTVLIARDGTERSIDDSAAPIRDASGKLLGVVLVFRDVTERRRAERQRDARLAVTQALAGASGAEDGAAGVLRAVCEHLGWDGGFLWTVDDDAGALGYLTGWCRPDVPAAEFERASRGRTFGRGEGLPGRVWAAGQPAWIPDVTEDPDFPRADAAARGGLHSAFACPIPAGERVLGVVEFFSRRIEEPDAGLLEMIGTVAGAVGQFLQRRRAEADLRAAAGRLGLALAAADLGDWGWDADSDLVTLSVRAADIFGIPPGTRPTWAELKALIREEDRGWVSREFEGAVADRSQYAIEYRVNRPDGLEVWVAALGRAYDAPMGGPLGMFGVVQDVTNRRRSEEALREQTRIAEALNRIGVMLAAELDLDRLVQVVTDEATRLTDARFGAFFYNVDDEQGGAYTLYTTSGVPREAFSGLPMPRATALFGPTFRGEGAVRLDDVTADPRYGKSAPHRGMPEGHPPVRSYLAVPVASRSGEVLGGLFFGHPEPGVFAESDERLAAGIAAQAAVAIDNARLYRELRAAKEEAEAANQAKTQFLAVLSHELRTPLNPILLAASSMLERPADPQELRPTLEMIRQNVMLQARLIDDLLDVMRIVRGKMPLHWEVADCHRLIDQAVQVCRSEVLGKRLRLEVDLAAAHRHVNADPARLQQVFWNLIRNAVKFTPEGGKVAVRTRTEPDPGQPQGLIVIEVSDTGIGIEPGVLPRIFDPFQQGETTITRTFGGLGLGLAICKGIVEAHGGTIAAESGGKGEGATFRIALKALPVPADEGDDRPAGGTPEVAEGRPLSLRVLVVDDEPATLRIMAWMLRGEGHAVTTASSVSEAIELYERAAFDLIVSDIGLPDGTGLDLMRRAVALRGPVPAIALTGYGMEEDIRRSREAGFTAHLTKPIDFAKLEAMIRQVAPTLP